jgi:hypothetical protein
MSTAGGKYHPAGQGEEGKAGRALGLKHGNL